MLRVAICVGDQPETGGFVEEERMPACTLRGHQAALVGGTAFCRACGSRGVIAKAGGARRSSLHGREIALEGDVLDCRCVTPPRMVASVQRTVWFDDRGESGGEGN